MSYHRTSSGEESARPRSNRWKIAKGIAGWSAVATIPLTTIYALASLYTHNGSEFKIVMNAGEPVSITDKGWGIAWGVFDRIHSLPKTRQITTVKDDEVNLRSKDGEQFDGGVRVEYQFRFDPEDMHRNKLMVKKLFRDFNIQDTRAFWDTDQVDPVEKTVHARSRKAALEQFAKIATDEYQGKMAEIADDSKVRLQNIVDGEDLPMSIVVVDTNGVTPAKEVQQRINRIASERREVERANVIIENAPKVIEAAKNEVAATLAFTGPLRAAGYGESTIVALNCQRLADRADRFGIPFGAQCNGPGQEFSVAVNPATLKAAKEAAAKAEERKALPAPVNSQP